MSAHHQVYCRNTNGREEIEERRRQKDDDKTNTMKEKTEMEEDGHNDPVINRG